jgi:hypothetical protein
MCIISIVAMVAASVKSFQFSTLTYLLLYPPLKMRSNLSNDHCNDGMAQRPLWSRNFLVRIPRVDLYLFHTYIDICSFVYFWLILKFSQTPKRDVKLKYVNVEKTKFVGEKMAWQLMVPSFLPAKESCSWVAEGPEKRETASWRCTSISAYDLQRNFDLFSIFSTFRILTLQRSVSFS